MAKAKAGKHTQSFDADAHHRGPIRVDAGTARCTVACGHYALTPAGDHYRAKFDPGDVVAWAGYEEPVKGGRTSYVKIDHPGGGTVVFPRSYFLARFTLEG